MRDGHFQEFQGPFFGHFQGFFKGQIAFLKDFSRTRMGHFSRILKENEGHGSDEQQATHNKTRKREP